MTSLKRTFYMLLGFTFPFFWAYHAAGFVDFLFKPIQMISLTQNKIWPSFITAFLLYAGLIILIEMVSRPQRKSSIPEWPDLRKTKRFEQVTSSQENSNEIVNNHKSFQREPGNQTKPTNEISP